MKKNIILSSILMVFVILMSTSCNENEPYQSIQPSLRDGVYEGDNLIITIDGKPAKFIKSVRIYSEMIGYIENTVTEPILKDDSIPIFHMSIIFNGFPGTTKELI